MEGDGDTRQPVKFSNWSFKAISGIGKRAATIEDRSIRVTLDRKSKCEQVDRLRHVSSAIFDKLARQLARFAQDNMLALSRVRPNLPDALNDRQQDNWEILLAVAEVAGGDWPQKARRAAVALNAAVSGEEDESRGVLLLQDVRDAFAQCGRGRVSSADLVAALVAMPDRPWAEYNRGKALSTNMLARLLRKYGITPTPTGPKHQRVSGYLAECFADAFNCYIPAHPLFRTSHPRTSRETNDLDQNTTSHRDPGCEVEESANRLKLEAL